jgi:hypothetical protein
MEKENLSSKDQLFYNLNKKILEIGKFTIEKKSNRTIVYHLECLGFKERFSTGINMKTKKFKEFIKNHLCSQLVSNSEFMKKMEQILTRESNLKELLD